jgi:hypothetical protein
MCVLSEHLRQMIEKWFSVRAPGTTGNWVLNPNRATIFFDSGMFAPGMVITFISGDTEVESRKGD